MLIAIIFASKIAKENALNSRNKDFTLVVMPKLLELYGVDKVVKNKTVRFLPQELTELKAKYLG